MNVVLISTYELGHQPFGLASPAAWLRAAGAGVTSLDLAVQPLDPAAVAAAGLVAIYLPMHTATRLAVDVIRQVRAISPGAELCCYGLYAPMNEPLLRRLGVATILGGEFESGLVALYRRLISATTDDRRPTIDDRSRVISSHPSSLAHRPSSEGQPEPRVSLERQTFLPPDRAGLPGLAAYAHVELADGATRTAGYTEASRGCKHLCRHCPIVPVYGGRFRVVQREVVLEDIRRQVAAGARHITFGDPDFFNGPGHAIPLVRALHAEHPELTYDVTIKVEHLLRHADLLPALRDTGCLFVTSAVESVDDATLERFDKRHTRADFARAAGLLRAAGLALNPTFVSFTPWTTRQGYLELLQTIWQLGLVEHVAPIQYAIRLLIPAGSRLLELAEVRELVRPFDEAALCYPWAHPDPRVDQLHQEVLRAVRARRPRAEAFAAVWRLTEDALGAPVQDRARYVESARRATRKPIPTMSEPWYC
ncbi:MAG: radical SAM protein [Kouleothrix sp.]|nr:radical SAM protein [Kouleothrix sp.]